MEDLCGRFGGLRVNETYEGKWNNNKPGASGCFLIGPIEQLKSLRELMQCAMDHRWQEQAPKLEETKQVVRDTFSTYQEKLCSGKLKLTRRKREKILGSKASYLETIEHSHYIVSSFNVKPSPDLVIPFQGALKELAVRLLGDTAVESLAYRDPMPVEVHPLVRCCFDASLKVIQREKAQGLGYLVGVEPLSFKSVLCGYTIPGVCTFYGCSSGEPSPLSCATKELREEATLDMGPLFTQQQQKEARMGLGLQELPLWIDPKGRRGDWGRLYLVVVNQKDRFALSAEGDKVCYVQQ